MLVSLFPFQTVALRKLRFNTAKALGEYRDDGTPQVVSYTAPTGAGKTIIMSALIESIYFGDENFPEQPNAIFLWLSDSPELNKQSKDKIDLKANRIRSSQTVMIDDTFNAEMLEDGKIYFLNTQKLGKNSNLTKHGDRRQYTIWETLSNTVREKSDRLYVIIDEAHRGMLGAKAATATSIMQKFLKGSPEDELPIMPVVIGITATPARFNNLVTGIGTTVIRKVITTAEDVRLSGLLKDRIIIKYPDTINNDMAVLQAAADDWRDKWLHWEQYCREQHYAYINPIFVVQVQNGSDNKISETDLDDCLRKISERTRQVFAKGEVVHTFGQTESALRINGLDVPYIEPSSIADDRNVKVVFFKENLSTGWDCPRAETMMSFRRANDATYIAQLLGRMVRTPMQMHIQVDDSLNDVHLFLPYFNAETVQEVIDELQSAEGANIPTEVIGEECGDTGSSLWTIKPVNKPVLNPTDINTDVEDFTLGAEQIDLPEVPDVSIDIPEMPELPELNIEVPDVTINVPDLEDTFSHLDFEVPTIETEVGQEEIDREEIVKAINEMGLLTYEVRSVKINDYLKSLFDLSGLLSRTAIAKGTDKAVLQEIVEMISLHIAELKDSGKYEALAEKVKQFKLNSLTFDVFGNPTDNQTDIGLFISTDEDLDRQLRMAENKLGSAGVAVAYGKRFYDEMNPNAFKIDVIIFAADNLCIEGLHAYAKQRFLKLATEYRKAFIGKDDVIRRKFDEIVKNSDTVTAHSFYLPETVQPIRDVSGKKYSNHLYVENRTGNATIKLNGWEEGVLEEEMCKPTFVCWLRNPSRASWSLTVPYKMNGVDKPAYPDMLAVHKDEHGGYIVYILEPHDPTRTDNLPKAKGFAEYAKKNGNIGGIQLIRKYEDITGSKFLRLDMYDMAVQEQVLKAMTNEELDHLFEVYGVKSE